MTTPGLLLKMLRLPLSSTEMMFQKGLIPAGSPGFEVASSFALATGSLGTVRLLLSLLRLVDSGPEGAGKFASQTSGRGAAQAA